MEYSLDDLKDYVDGYDVEYEFFKSKSTDEIYKMWLDLIYKDYNEEDLIELNEFAKENLESGDITNMTETDRDNCRDWMEDDIKDSDKLNYDELVEEYLQDKNNYYEAVDRLKDAEDYSEDPYSYYGVKRSDFY